MVSTLDCGLDGFKHGRRMEEEVKVQVQVGGERLHDRVSQNIQVEK